MNTNVTIEKGVVINGVRWATRNVGRRGKFADSSEEYGEYYTFEEAKAACPDGWRLPTEDELQSLADADSIWTSENGVNGRLFGNSVFLPAAGYYSSGAGNVVHISTEGGYWSSTQNYSNEICRFGFNCDILNMDSLAKVGFGRSIRCVKDENYNAVPENTTTEDSCTADPGIVINGVMWATRNVGSVGQFTETPEDYGKRYSVNEAKSACPKGWRLPTKEEFELLLDAEKTFTTQDGINGLLFENGAFFPAAGVIGGEAILSIGETGYYLSDFRDNNGAASNWIFNNEGRTGWYPDDGSQNSRYCLRCVKDENNTIVEEKGVVINGVTWATRNVGKRGEFVAAPENYGEWYTLAEAKVACPDGWRLPTNEELQSLKDTESALKTRNAVLGRLFGNSVFLPAAGVRDHEDGNLYNRGKTGLYRSATSVLSFGSKGMGWLAGDSDRDGFCIRCVKITGANLY
ncbi:hypothetical protein FACS1894201_06830 [Bacteroidia bacterium]|nr:hypothetical protein FACS1894201_06830 [Bacteroidia bacterium]